METVSIANIKPNPFQARQSIDPQRIRELADEIKETGFWPTGLLARQINGNYELVFGHRRLEALKLLGHKTVELEIVKFDDIAMATKALVENLQREGLTDLEKANGIKRLMQFGDRSPKKVAEMLGYSETTIREFLHVAELDAETKREIEKARYRRSAVKIAEQVAGPEFVRVAARKNLRTPDLHGIQREVAKLKGVVREKVKKKLQSGELTNPEAVKRAARKLTFKSNSKAKAAPDDLMDVLFKWTGDIKAWREQLQAITPYRDYFETEPHVAQKFRKEITGLIEDLKKLL